MRLAVGFSLLDWGGSTLAGLHGGSLVCWAMGLGAILAGGTIAVGFLTPFAGAVAGIGSAVAGFSLLTGSTVVVRGDAHFALHLAVVSIALVLLGPGAYSVDARLFGRREIIIPKGRI